MKPVSRIREYVDGNRISLTYEDGVADINLSKLAAFHGHHERLATSAAVHRIGLPVCEAVSRRIAVHDSDLAHEASRFRGQRVSQAARTQATAIT